MSQRLALRACGLAAALGVAFAFPAHAAVELSGQTRATFEWSPASGPVAGYFVYVDFEGGEEILYGSIRDGTRTTIEGSAGDAFRLSVAAFDAQGNRGPRSPRSELVTFAEAPPPPPPPPDDPPVVDPPSDDPPADDPPVVEPPSDDPPADDPPVVDPPSDDPSEDDAPEGDPPAAPSVLLDFDGDGVSDVLQRNPRSGGVRLWLMDGTRVVEERELPPLAAGLEIVGNGDHDGDGRADALCFDPAGGQLEVWLTGDEGVAQRGPIGERLAEGFRVVGSGDYDGDGRADVLLRDRRGRRLELWYLDGLEVLGVVEIDDSLGRGWRVRASGDYDGDERADVLWQNRRSGELRVWSLGESGLQETVVGRVDPDLRVVGSADTTGDGISELLLESASDRSLSLAALTERGIRGPVRLGNLALEGTGDFDGDGRVDLIVRDRRRRGPMVLFMDGGRATAVEELPPLGRGWRLSGVGE